MRSTIPALLFCLLAVAGGAAAAADSTYIGARVCDECHDEQYRLWLGSHHDLAMQPADETSVLGDFDDATFTYANQTTRFFRDGDHFMVRTDGPDGKPHDYRIRYTFGVTPLQQYLIELPGGRLQALGIAWDTRAANAGGQRWFHLYPDENVTHEDPLHWTGLYQNWNTQCADCHSTGLKKNYNAGTRRFDTTWAEPDVACEACHGPGADHVAWAVKAPGKKTGQKTKGLTPGLEADAGERWRKDPVTGKPVRKTPRGDDTEIEVCAPCHSRRSLISDSYRPGDAFLDHYAPELLREGLYFADGQIQDEVYVYGSFLQSRMYAAGVTCSDCHDPHSLKLRQPGDAVCGQCHSPADYATPAHHFHKADSAAAHCVECHMPARTYMRIDARRDHSFRIPRPDLSENADVPNACNGCHTDKSPAWAAKQVKAWYGHTPVGFQQYAQTLSAARRGEAIAGSALTRLLADADAPAIARATAAVEFDAYLTPNNLSTLKRALRDDSALVRRAALHTVGSLPAEMRADFAADLLDDPVRAVRIEAARVMAGSPRDKIDAPRRAAFDKAIAEYRQSLVATAERPDSQLLLGILETDVGNYDAAERAYLAAIEAAPLLAPAYINLSDLYRRQHKDSEGERPLRNAIDRMPDNPDLRHALGLLLVREKRLEDALPELQKAATLDTTNARYSYVYGVALHSAGQTEKALAVLEDARRRFPGDRDIAYAVSSLAAEQKVKRKNE